MRSDNPCSDPDTVCVNTVGAYECARTSASPPPLPATSIGTQLASNHRGNVRGSDVSTSSCYAGYKPANDSSVTCIDVDECNEQLHSCDPGERCVNEIGSYRYETRVRLAAAARKAGLLLTFSEETTHSSKSVTVIGIVDAYRGARINATMTNETSSRTSRGKPRASR